METSSVLSLARRLIVPQEASLRRNGIVAATLSRYGEAALRFAIDARIRVLPLRRTQRYDAASPALARLHLGVDDWPAPPAGLFVVEERSVYLRSRNPMTVAHEFGHALDCALGCGVYRSGLDPAIRRFFAEAREFVTPYAATGLDEYFAEGLRAYIEVNDAASPWPRVSRDRLARIDPRLFTYVDTLFTSGFQEQNVA